MAKKTDLICVGAIAGAFGVRGEVRLKSFTADPGAIADYGPVSTEDGKTEYDISLSRGVKNGLAARLSGVTTKDQAYALRGVRLFLPRASLPSLPDDEFYYTDLIGLPVYDAGGGLLGKVKAVLNHGADDLLEIQRQGGKTALLPFTKSSVPTVDLTAGRIVADPPDGVFE
jgi:16S rRNA processing protein RimM